jgi:hypothetical protein
MMMMMTIIIIHEVISNHIVVIPVVYEDLTLGKRPVGRREDWL